MTKAELLTALAGKYYKVLTPVLQKEENNIKKYVVVVYDIVDTDSFVTHNINFFVEDEGLPSEQAFWSGAEPKPAVLSFTEEVEQYITDNILAGNIEAGFIESVSEVDETATGFAIVVVGADLVRKDALFDKEAGQVRHRVVT